MEREHAVTEIPDAGPLGDAPIDPYANANTPVRDKVNDLIDRKKCMLGLGRGRFRNRLPNGQDVLLSRHRPGMVKEIAPFAAGPHHREEHRYNSAPVLGDYVVVWEL